MPETTPCIQHLKSLISFRIPTPPQAAQITETMPVLSTGVKNDFFLSGNPELVHTICFHLRLILLNPNTGKVNQIYLTCYIKFSSSDIGQKSPFKDKGEFVLLFSLCSLGGWP